MVRPCTSNLEALLRRLVYSINSSVSRHRQPTTKSRLGKRLLKLLLVLLVVLRRPHQRPLAVLIPLLIILHKVVRLDNLNNRPWEPLVLLVVFLLKACVPVCTPCLAVPVLKVKVLKVK